MDLITTYLNENFDYNGNNYRHELCLLFENGTIDDTTMIGILSEKVETNTFNEKMKDLFAFLSGNNNSSLNSISDKVGTELQEIRGRINKARDIKTLNEISSELVMFKAYLNKMRKHKLTSGNGVFLRGLNVSAKEQMFKNQDKEIEILFDKIKEKKKTL